MKTKTFILLLFFLLLSSGFVPVRAESSGDFIYSILADGTAEISAYQGSDPIISTPEEIEGIKVTSIGSGAFSYNSDLREVTLTEGITSVEDFAFGECTALETVTLPSSLTWLGDFAFQGDVLLTKAALPDNLIHIGTNPFDRCDLLEAVEMRADHPFYAVENGILYDRRAFQLVTYPGGHQEQSYTVPEWITSIGMAAFSENKQITEIILPDNISEINGNPFCGCTALRSIKISPQHLTYAFKDNTLYNIRNCALVAYLWGSNASSYTVAAGTASIGQEAFYKHPELKSVKIPDSVTMIGSAAFSQSGLSTIRVPSGVRVLSNSVFSECTELTSVTLPSGLTTIESSAFFGCSKLRSVNLPDSLRSIGYAAFARCGSLRGVTIPEGVLSIGDYAYAGCSGLISLSLPKSIFTIGENAFFGDTYLVLTVLSGSYAEEWAEKNNLKYRHEPIRYVDGENI